MTRDGAPSTSRTARSHLRPTLHVVRVAFASLVVAAVVLPGSASASPMVIDEFSGPSGSTPDPDLWGYITGHGWDRGIQTYQSSNAVLDGDGNLAIRAVETENGYVSGRVQTKNKLSLDYGRVSARIKMPAGQGLWPAFWLLGTGGGAAPESAEVDVIELVGDASTYYTTIHAPGGGGEPHQVQFSGSIGDLSTDYHEYWVLRAPDAIAVGIDVTTLGTFTPESLPPGAHWAFDQPMYAILNLAVGGDWAGPPDASTQFPATMLVDWFRWEPV